MNTAHWHLALNHFPVIGTIIGTLILMTGYLFFKGNNVVKNIALGVLVLSAIIAIPAFFSGEGAEEIVERVPGVTENKIEPHEESGKFFFIAIEVLGVLAALSFFTSRMKNKLAGFLYLLTTLLAIGVATFGLQVANSGGKIRHSEINSVPDQNVLQNKPVERDND